MVAYRHVTVNTKLVGNHSEHRNVVLGCLVKEILLRNWKYYHVFECFIGENSLTYIRGLRPEKNTLPGAKNLL